MIGETMQLVHVLGHMCIYYYIMYAYECDVCIGICVYSIIISGSVIGY